MHSEQLPAERFGTLVVPRCTDPRARRPIVDGVAADAIAARRSAKPAAVFGSPSTPAAMPSGRYDGGQPAAIAALVIKARPGIGQPRELRRVEMPVSGVGYSLDGGTATMTGHSIRFSSTSGAVRLSRLPEQVGQLVRRAIQLAYVASAPSQP
jgi:hypothetical protein